MKIIYSDNGKSAGIWSLRIGNNKVSLIISSALYLETTSGMQAQGKKTQTDIDKLDEMRRWK